MSKLSAYFLVLAVLAIFSCRNHEETLSKAKAIDPEDILSVKILSVYKGGCLGRVHFYLQSKDFQPFIQVINSYTKEDIITSTENIGSVERYEVEIALKKGSYLPGCIQI